MCLVKCYPESMENIIDELMRIRTEKKITLENLAHELGVTMGTLWRWTKGKFKPSPMAIIIIESWIAQNKTN